MESANSVSNIHAIKTLESKFIIIAATVMTLWACGGGGDDSGSVVDPPIMQANRAPTISGQANSAIPAGDAYSFIPAASDPDGDTLTFSAQNLAGWMTLDSATGEISGTPSTFEIGNTDNIIIRVSDGSLSAELAPFSVSVSSAKVTSDDVATTGARDPIPEDELSDGAASGFNTEGDVEFELAGELIMIEGADLKLEFDADENLVSLVGDGVLPPAIGDFFAINSRTKVRMGLYTGEEVNADPELNILLKDEFYYLVYYIGVSTDVELGDRNGGENESITLTTPLSGEILIVGDPLDSFYYYYANTPFGIQGVGESDQGFIPFEPIQPSPNLASFDGHEVLKAGISLGIKVFDFFSLFGEQIVRNPEFADIDWDDPLNSEINFKAGFNGTADFALSVFGVGLFEFPVAATSATIDVGVDRQQMAMQMTIAPDVSWQPDWFSLLPETAVVGEWVINGDETFSASLTGSYKSEIPKANMSGSIVLNNDGATLTAKIPDGVVPLEVSAQFINSRTIYTLTTEVDIGPDVADAVDEAFDKTIADKQAAFEDLEAKTADYEIEVSLNGLREILPSMMDGAVASTSTIPGDMESAVSSGVKKEINDNRVCFIVCTPSNSARDLAASTAGTTAKDQATAKIAAPIAAFKELKKQALEGDDESLRQALEDALYQAHSYAVVSGGVSVRVPIAGIPDFTINRSFSKRVISTNNADRILNAADNAFRIQETSDLRIEAGVIYDEIPVEAAVEKARADVADGLTIIPTFNGAGLTVAGNSLTGFILLSDEQHEVEFNVLDPKELLTGIGETASSLLVDESNPD